MELNDYSSLCSSRSQEMEILQEILEPLNLITVNNDCKELIFDYLEWQDLIRVAETAKPFYTSVCRVFSRKYSNSRIDIGCMFNIGFGIG